MLPVDDAIKNLLNYEFQTELRNFVDHSLLTEAELRDIRKTILQYIVRSLEERFADETFYVDNCSFIEPLKKKRHTRNAI